MTQVAYRRLRAFWPQASIYVTTSDPSLLQQYCPGALPLNAAARRAALTIGMASGVLQYRVPAAVAERERRLLHQAPGFVRLLARLLPSIHRHRALDYLNVLTSCNLAIASGAGQLTDPFRDDAILTLNALGLAAAAGIPVCLVGQGIGPITNRPLRARARHVLPRASFIALREGLQGLPVLADAKVAPERIMVTGDDAIEMAHAQRPAVLGDALGINIRMAAYARVDEHFEAISRAMTGAARELTAPLAALAVSTHPQESDEAAVSRILADAARVDPPVSATDIVERLACQAGRCRIVVTGSYHAAVFALSQGVSVVGLANTPYYASKFAGLRDQFGTGCVTVVLDQPDVAGRLRAAVIESWATAEQSRPALLDSARRQMARGHEAYQRMRACAEASSLAR